MPRNLITEIDRTGSVGEIIASNTVFVPIETKEKTEPILCKTLKELEDNFEDKLLEDAAVLEYELNLGYKLAKHLIRLGLPVLVQGFTDALTANDWEALEDKNNYDIRFLTTGAFEGSSADDIDEKMVECAKNRGDCTALVGFNETYTDGEVVFSYEVTNILALLQDSDLTKDNIDIGGYAAAFTPFFYTADSDFTSDPETEVLIPAPFGYLFAYARSIRNNPEWFAVAGFERGVIPELTRVKHKFSTAEVNALQNRADDSSDNDGRGVNAIAYIRPAGFIIYGNRTLKKNEGELTATSFINVRNMVSLVKKVAFEAANRFTFEQNSDILWVNYKSYIEPTLDRITHGNGALGYSINKLKTTARAKMQAEIIIQPIEAVEDIELAVIMTDANTVVSE